MATKQRFSLSLQQMGRKDAEELVRADWDLKR